MRIPDIFKVATLTNFYKSWHQTNRNKFLHDNRVTDGSCFWLDNVAWLDSDYLVRAKVHCVSSDEIVIALTNQAASLPGHLKNHKRRPRPSALRPNFLDHIRATHYIPFGYGKQRVEIDIALPTYTMFYGNTTGSNRRTKGSCKNIVECQEMVVANLAKLKADAAAPSCQVVEQPEVAEEPPTEHVNSQENLDAFLETVEILETRDASLLLKIGDSVDTLYINEPMQNKWNIKVYHRPIYYMAQHGGYFINNECDLADQIRLHISQRATKAAAARVASGVWFCDSIDMFADWVVIESRQDTICIAPPLADDQQTTVPKSIVMPAAIYHRDLHFSKHGGYWMRKSANPVVDSYFRGQ